MNVGSTAVMVMHNIEARNGGLTFAVLKRAEAMAGVCGRVIVLTYGFHRDFKGCVEHWRSSLRNGHRIEFVNMLEGCGGRLVSNPGLGAGEVSASDRRDSRGARVFSDGLYRRYERRSPGGGVEYADIFEAPWIRVRKDVYSVSGARLVEHHMDRSLNVPAYSVYFNQFDKPVYSVRLDPRQGKPLTYFSFLGDRAIEYATIEYLVADWVQTVLNKLHDVILFVDSRSFAAPLARPNVSFRVFCLHSSHLEYPSEDRASLGATLLPLESNLERYDRILVSTNAQREDLLKYWKLPDRRVVVATHPQSAVAEQDQQPLDFQSHKVVAVARYHAAKNLSDAIRAFSIVRAAIPDATFDLYGYGPEENSLQDLITSLGLAECVKLRGFASDVGAVYRSAGVTVLSSQYEGQAMVLSESMAYGVPVVSYDVNYGPSEIIRHEVDGLVVPKHDVGALAKGVIRILTEPPFRRVLSLEARKVSERFSDSAYVAVLKAMLFNENSGDKGGEQ